MDLGLSGKTALVCASTSGLGLAVAQALDDEGANVVVCGRRGDVAREHAAQLRNGLGVEADLTDADAPARLVRAAEDRFGPVDILILNNGGPPPSAAAEVDRDDLARAMDLLLYPMQALIGLTVPGMRSRGWGRVLAVGSIGVDEPLANLATSNAGRAALAGLLKTLSREVAADGVTVNMVLPGRIMTPRIEQLDAARAERTGASIAEIRAEAQNTIPAGRSGKPSEFGAVAAFLCSERASYVTGSRIRVDGGLVRH